MESSPNERDMETMHNYLKTYEATPFPDGFADSVMEAVLKNSTSSPPLAVIHTLKPAYILRYAAVLIILLLAGSWYWTQTRINETPYGYQATRTLPDGSIVQLSSGSRISYKSFWWRPERRVRLEGEAFFQVTHSEKPFIVETFNAEVQVLGTSFNVRSWPADIDARYTAVTLEEGSISVNSLSQPDQKTLMSPSQSITIYNQQPSPDSPQQLSTHEVNEVLYWRSGGYSFHDETLSSVINELERRHDLTLYLPPELQRVPITYIQPNNFSIEQVLEDLSATYGLSYRPTAEGYEIMGSADSIQLDI